MADTSIEEIVGVVFKKLSLAYGRDFLSRWEGMDLNEVRADWCHELAGCEKSPHSVLYALQNLPPKPPTVYEFRAIARRMPPPEMVRIEAPAADPRIVRAELAKMAKYMTRGMRR